MNIMQSYEDWLHTLNRSPKTIEAYTYAAAEYSAFVNGQVLASSPADIKRYVHMLKLREIAAATINGRLAALQSFFSFLKIEGISLDNPMFNERLSINRKVPVYIHSDLMDAAISAMNPTTYKQWRGFVAVCMLYYVGVRASEAINIRWKDINEKDMTIWVYDGKGGKDRVVYCPDFIPIVHTFGIIFPHYPEEYVLEVDFPQRKRSQGAAITSKELRQVISAMLFPFLPPEVIHPHALRHSCATRWAEMGWTAEKIAKNLGHNQIDTSLIYLHLAQKKNV